MTMIDVRVHITNPPDEDAVVISVVGYREDPETREVQAYRGYPDPLSAMDELSGSFHEDGWLWQPMNPGDILPPSIKFPGIWLNGFDQAIRAYTGINDTKVAAAWAMARRAEDRLDALDRRVDSIDNAAANMGAMASEALENSKEALRRYAATVDPTD